MDFLPPMLVQLLVPLRHWLYPGEPVELERWLSEQQIAEAATRPDMIIDFARMVADRAQARSGVRPMVTAKVSVSLNGGPYRDLVDPTHDLAAR